MIILEGWEWTLPDHGRQLEAERNQTMHWVVQGDDGQWIHRTDAGVVCGVYAHLPQAWASARQAAQEDSSQAILTGPDGRIWAQSRFDPHHPN